MPMTADQLKETFDALVRDIQVGRPVPFTKTDLKTAADAAFDFLGLTTTRTAFNNALPEPFKSGATVQEKALLLAHAALRVAGR